MQKDDVIYRQDAIKAFKKELTVGESKGNYITICSAVGYEGAKQILESLPPAQPKMGKWIKNHSVIRCSECKRSSWSLSFEDLVKSFKYCPNCGARMKEDNTDG